MVTGRWIALALLLGWSSLSPSLAMGRTVLGYYPYWNRGRLQPHWELLTHLAISHLEVTSTGTLTRTDFWRSEEVRQIIEEAHRQGGKVIVSATNFNPTSLHTLLTSPGAKRAAIAALVQEALVTQAGDGLDIDFEGVPPGDRDLFTAFVADVRRALDAHRPGIHLSLALPSRNSGAYDADRLVAYADTVMLMTYDWAGPTSRPGPNAPLTGGSPWESVGVTESLQAYLEDIGSAARTKVLLGLPLYGFDFPTYSSSRGAAATGPGRVVYYIDAREDAARLGRKWDPISATPYFVYQTDTWHQVWYDDEVSLGLKMDLAKKEGIGGIGMWALGYEDASFWSLVRAKYPPPPRNEAPPIEETGPESVPAPPPPWTDEAVPEQQEEPAFEPAESGGCSVGGRRAAMPPVAVLFALALGGCARRAVRARRARLR